VSASTAKPDKPSTLETRVSALRERILPLELQAMARFVLWRWTWRAGKWTKPPYQPSGRLAKADDPTTWATFEDVVKVADSDRFDGIGIVLTGDGLVGVELDHSSSGEMIDGWALEIIQQLNAYTEYSPSGTGLHILGYGKLPPGPRVKTRDGHKVEVYESGRYLTLTGLDLDGYPERIEARTEQLEAFYSSWFEWTQAAQPLPNGASSSGVHSRSDEELLARARMAKNGTEFRNLFDNGDLNGHGGDQSSADMALSNHLMFWAGRDAERVDQLFRRSALMRPKWDQKHYSDGRTYGQGTIAKAMETVRVGWEPGGAGAPQALILAGPATSNGGSAEESISAAAMASSPEPGPDLPAADAFYGLAGRITDLIDPYVESDRAATLVQLLTTFGVAAGIRPHFMVGASRHAPVTYIGLVGRTSRARKGTSWDPIESLFRSADAKFSARIISGIGSGERLVWLVRDPVLDKKGGLVDEGADDRRLLLQESELARLLIVVNREASTLSPCLRLAYDGKSLRNEVKTNGSIATIHHIGVIGHCTVEELRDKLTEQQVRNGLANRVAWFLARRDKKLDDPAVFEGADVDEAITELREKLRAAQGVHRLQRSPAAQKVWKEWYFSVPDDPADIIGAITNRAEAQVIRFSSIYALTDGTPTIEIEHLRAAIALWDFSARCVSHIFGAGTGNIVADRILEELSQGPLTTWQISNDVFCRNINAIQLEEAARLLERRGLIVRERVPSGDRGRPPTQWRLA
jgi:hypothetical protein